MKWILSLAVVVLFSCNDKEQKLPPPKPLVHQVTFPKAKLLFEVETLDGAHLQKVYLWDTPDGCQYIGEIYSSSSDWMSHYGLCNNPKHRPDYKADTTKDYSFPMKEYDEKIIREYLRGLYEKSH